MKPFDRTLNLRLAGAKESKSGLLVDSFLIGGRTINGELGSIGITSSSLLPLADRFFDDDTIDWSSFVNRSFDEVMSTALAESSEVSPQRIKSFMSGVALRFGGFRIGVRDDAPFNCLNNEFVVVP